MFKRVCLVLVIACAGAAALSVAVSGQANPPTSDSPMDKLLAEVRSLRAEVNQAAGASMRMQLLVARLALQEGRISTLSRQLADVRQQLSTLQMGLAPFAAQIKQAQDAGNLDPGANTPFEQMLRHERELRSQETELSSLISTEQRRWIDFNSRLDDLERQLPHR
jgi:uncharacterized coiled-coil protein SlyX